MWNPDAGKHGAVDLSTTSASSSSGVLATVRARRLAREQERRQELAATAIQRIWRGRASARNTRAQLLKYLEERPSIGIEDTGKVLVLLSGDGDREGFGAVVQKWATSALEKDASERPAFAGQIDNDEFAYRFALLLRRLLIFIAKQPRTVLSASLLGKLVDLVEPSAYAGLDDERRRSFTATLGADWVKTGVSALREYITAGARLPKKKHPLSTPMVSVIMAPLAIAPLDSDSPFIAPLLQDLMTLPSLPFSLPLPALTTLTRTLPLFQLLLPAAAANPALLDGGGLSTEIGKTHFLSNLATFGITGGMLQRQGAQGMRDWVAVVGTMFSTLGEGWGRWVATSGSDVPEPMMVDDSDSDDEEDNGKRVVRRPKREPLPANVAARLHSFASPAHLGTLVNAAMTASADSKLLVDFSFFVLGLLNAFRGSARWEATLDAVMEGRRGARMTKMLWREGVRGKWGSGRKDWETFSSNPNRAMLLLLSHMYCHYLLLTPDDEFFSNDTNALSLDEVLDLSTIWRDLAYWGFMEGVSTGDGRADGRGTEEVRSLFTRGVTRVAERNARRKFAPHNFWVMRELNNDINSFVKAVRYEEDSLQGTAAPRGLRQRELAHIAPRLGLLNNLPMAVPFETRVDVFRQFVRADQARNRGNYPYDHRRALRAQIRRASVAHDGFRQLNRPGMLKGLVQIQFVDDHGFMEAGIDGGGLFKEFLTSLVKEAFDVERGLWLANDENELYPNPHAYATEPHQLEWYTFLGRMIGKALYEDILVDVTFAGFFLAKWLGRQSYLDDLSSLDAELYRGLISVKNYPKPEELSLTFTVTEDDFGVARSVDLVPGGSEIPVTAENRAEYIQLMCQYKLGRQFAAQSRAFFSGLAEIIDPRWLRMFDQAELAQLLGGEHAGIDLADLKRHTTFSGFAPDSPTPTAFWRVLESLSQEQRGKLVKFVTSCARPPLLGFKYLNPEFAVRNAGGDTQRLPTASSCANLLKLPDYRDERVLKEKLLQAIESGAGFDLS